MKFDDYRIAGILKKNIAQMGFRRPTDIQFKAIPHILKGEDLLAVAQTGTGKTAAYGIPVLHQLMAWKARTRQPQHLKALVLVPTHELAIQVGEVLSAFAKGTGIVVMSLYGGVEQEAQIEQLKKGVHLLVCTPGRLFDLRSQGYVDMTPVETLILDEADQMLANHFLTDIKGVLRFVIKRRQTLFFSATINKSIKQLAYSLVRGNAIRIQIAPDNPVARNVDHKVAFIEMDDKRYFLERLYREHKSAKILAFVRTKVRAERVQAAMQRVSINSSTLHGDKSQAQRNTALDQFKSGAIRLLIATDVSARGVDIDQVDFVVNYDLPQQAEIYVHRIGRTGRGGHRGNAISFCSTDEKPLLEDIEFYLGRTVQVLHIDKGEYNDTLDFTKDTRGMDWKALIQQELKTIEAEAQQYSKKKKGKKKKR